MDLQLQTPTARESITSQLHDLIQILEKKILDQQLYDLKPSTSLVAQDHKELIKALNTLMTALKKKKDYSSFKQKIPIYLNTSESLSEAWENARDDQDSQEIVNSGQHIIRQQNDQNITSKKRHESDAAKESMMALQQDAIYWWDTLTEQQQQNFTEIKKAFIDYFGGGHKIKECRKRKNKENNQQSVPLISNGRTTSTAQQSSQQIQNIDQGCIMVGSLIDTGVEITSMDEDTLQEAQLKTKPAPPLYIQYGNKSKSLFGKEVITSIIMNQQEYQATFRLVPQQNTKVI
ncbi:hypothetical protein BDC45DRAFT_571455 [Circinella umbellata]|nr:hypothetical protein BDC45DRAFT_575785 [Circinella umbellata]KAI7852176.1 hypothetical protein BDC45DRAFT_571455 [Circinella umbellata]